MLPKSGLGRPGGSRVVYTGTQALKNKPAADQGEPPWLTEVLRLSGPLAARPAALRPSLRWEVQLETRGTLGKWRIFLEEAQSCSGPVD